MQIKAVIYARFSSDRQNEESIAAQHRACREYAQRNGIEIIGTYDDEAISGREGKTELRREYQKLLRDAQAKRFDAILIHKYDRVARSLNEHVTLEMRLKKWGVDLIAVAQDFGRSNEAKIMRAVIWSMSEYYSDNLADEVKKGHRETALQGKHNGGYAPFGYDVVDQRYIINELEAAYVRRIFEAAANRAGFKDLIAEMEAAGITGKRGRPIKYPQIYEILRNEKYTGVYTYSPQEEESRGERRSKPNAIRIENALPVIIGKAQFMEVQKIMEGRKQSGRKAGYLCSGLGYCQCGAKLHGFTSRRKGHEYKYYICSAHCGARMIHMEDMDAAVLGYLHDLLSEENQELIAKAMRTYEGSAKDRIEGFEAARKKKIKELQANYDALMKSLREKLLTLPGDTDVLPGHGHPTSIAREAATNPFLLPFNEPNTDWSDEDGLAIDGI